MKASGRCGARRPWNNLSGRDLGSPATTTENDGRSLERRVSPPIAGRRPQTIHTITLGDAWGASLAEFLMDTSDLSRRKIIVPSLSHPRAGLEASPVPPQ